jgi:hypothetical protein
MASKQEQAVIDAARAGIGSGRPGVDWFNRQDDRRHLVEALSALDAAVGAPGETALTPPDMVACEHCGKNIRFGGPFTGRAESDGTYHDTVRCRNVLKDNVRQWRSVAQDAVAALLHARRHCVDAADHLASEANRIGRLT